MPNPLTPEQQAALETFETDAQAAQQASEDNAASQTAMVMAEQKAAADAQNAITTHTKALESAQAFIQTMVPSPSSTPPAGAAVSSAKK